MHGFAYADVDGDVEELALSPRQPFQVHRARDIPNGATPPVQMTKVESDDGNNMPKRLKRSLSDLLSP
jgi:hypothetical protein